MYRSHTGVNGYGSIFLKTVAQQGVRHGAPEREDGEFFIVTSMPSNYTKALEKLSCQNERYAAWQRHAFETCKTENPIPETWNAKPWIVRFWDLVCQQNLMHNLKFNASTSCSCNPRSV